MFCFSVNVFCYETRDLKWSQHDCFCSFPHGICGYFKPKFAWRAPKCYRYQLKLSSEAWKIHSAAATCLRVLGEVYIHENYCNTSSKIPFPLSGGQQLCNIEYRAFSKTKTLISVPNVDNQCDFSKKNS